MMRKGRREPVGTGYILSSKYLILGSKSLLLFVLNFNTTSYENGFIDQSCLLLLKTIYLKVGIDLLAIQQKSLDRALFLYIFIHEIRSSGVRASITIVHIRKFYKM